MLRETSTLYSKQSLRDLALGAVATLSLLKMPWEPWKAQLPCLNTMAIFQLSSEKSLEGGPECLRTIDCVTSGKSLPCFQP
jgi:hypothetical protein